MIVILFLVAVLLGLFGARTYGPSPFNRRAEGFVVWVVICTCLAGALGPTIGFAPAGTALVGFVGLSVGTALAAIGRTW